MHPDSVWRMRSQCRSKAKSTPSATRMVLNTPQTAEQANLAGRESFLMGVHNVAVVQDEAVHT